MKTLKHEVTAITNFVTSDNAGLAGNLEEVTFDLSIYGGLFTMKGVKLVRTEDGNGFTFDATEVHCDFRDDGGERDNFFKDKLIDGLYDVGKKVDGFRDLIPNFILAEERSSYTTKKKGGYKAALDKLLKAHPELLDEIKPSETPAQEKADPGEPVVFSDEEADASDPTVIEMLPEEEAQPEQTTESEEPVQKAEEKSAKKSKKAKK